MAIHASRADQWEGVRAAFYADVTEPLVLLEIDTDLLDVPVVEEVPAPGMTENSGPPGIAVSMKPMTIAPA